MKRLAEFTPDDLNGVRESYEVECKAAQGRDGRGALPESMWATYSAFANTQGGYIFLGAQEQEDGTFNLMGLQEPEQAGSGFPKILRAWREQRWQRPLLREHEVPEYTVLEMVMAPLITQDARERLASFGFETLPELQQVGLYLSLQEGETTVQRVAEVSGNPLEDVQTHLERLSQAGWLAKRWRGRAWRYGLSEEAARKASPRDVREAVTEYSSLRRTHPFPRTVLNLNEERRLIPDLRV